MDRQRRTGPVAQPPEQINQRLVDHYNAHAPAMQNTAWFYNWFFDVWARYAPGSEASICDIGCGTGTLLRGLAARGYQNLSGVDVAPRCVELSRAAVPEASIGVHNIVAQPLSRQYDVLIMTTVIDFLCDPETGLRNVAASLRPDGHAMVSFRNREAYWPLYHLRSVARHIHHPRLRHWFLHVTTPLPMRRDDQPCECIYSPGEARALLRSAGLEPIGEHSYQWLPMLWLPELPTVIAVLQRLDAISRSLPGKGRHYWHFFVCTRGVA